MSLKVKLGKVTLKNPVTVASGTFGYGKDFEDLVDLKKIGAIITKTITVNPRLGNSPPRLWETSSGMMNAIGLQNDGVDNFLKVKVPILKKLGTMIIPSISATDSKDFVYLRKCMEDAGFKSVEVNLSCPNISYATAKQKQNKKSKRNFRVKAFAQEEKATFDLVSKLRKKSKLNLIVKLSPNVTDIASIAASAEDAGADVISLVNTFLALAIDIETKKPRIANVTGGLSGPAIKPIAVRMVNDVYNTVKIPVLGMGGIITVADAVEFMIAGATAISIGTANFVDPRIAEVVAAGLEKFCKHKEIKNINQLVGSIKI